MADKNLNQVDGGQIADPSNGRFYIIVPDGGAPTGWQDHYIEYDDLASLLQAQITSNDSDISTLQTSVTALQNLTAKRVDTGKNSAYSFSLPAKSLIEGFVVYYEAGTSINFKVGTSVGGEQIVSQKTGIADSTTKQYSIARWYPTTYDASQTIYVTISGGTATVITLYKKNLTTT